MNDKQITETIKKSVGKAIEIAGTQRKLADKAGLSQGAISKYMRGDARPKGETAWKLSKAVGFKIPREDFAPHACGKLNQDSAA